MQDFANLPIVPNDKSVSKFVFSVIAGSSFTWDITRGFIDAVFYFVYEVC